MKRKKINNRGVTLVELVIALAVLSMLLVAVIMMMSNNSVIYRKTKADINVQTSAQETYNSIQDCIMQAKYIELWGYTDADATEKIYKKGSLITPTDSNTASFETLMSVDETTGKASYTTVYPTRLVVTYSVENNDEMNNKNCTATFYFCRYTDKEGDKCNLYVTREYDFTTTKASKWNSSLKGPNNWTPAKGAGSAAEDRKVFDEWLYTSSLQQAKMTVDYETQSVDLMLDFYDRGMKYNTSGIVSVRNSYVMKEMRNRLALDIEVTETE